MPLYSICVTEIYAGTENREIFRTNMPVDSNWELRWEKGKKKNIQKLNIKRHELVSFFHTAVFRRGFNNYSPNVRHTLNSYTEKIRHKSAIIPTFLRFHLYSTILFSLDFSHIQTLSLNTRNSRRLYFNFKYIWNISSMCYECLTD